MKDWIVICMIFLAMVLIVLATMTPKEEIVFQECYDVPSNVPYGEPKEGMIRTFRSCYNNDAKIQQYLNGQWTAIKTVDEMENYE